MAKRVLLALSHSIEEHDQVKLLAGLGYDVASIGGYINPHAPHDPKRPAIPEAPYFPEVQEAVDAQGTPDNLGAAQKRIPESILEWLGDDGVIIFHHYLDERLFPQWEHLREWRAAGGRVVWRTVGQSVESNERAALPFREDGLEIVRYSPRERNIPGFAGEDALIRFYKDPEEWCGWTGEVEGIINITQNIARRAEWCNYGFWQQVTAGLPARLLGPGSEDIGGEGEMSLDRMQGWLRKARCYLYTGTQPASYTLGLLEAMMTGIPVVCIGPAHMTIFPYGPELFEACDFVGPFSSNKAEDCREMLEGLLADHDLAARVGQHQRYRVMRDFATKPVGAAWAKFLG